MFLEVTFSRYLGTRIARIWEYSGGFIIVLMMGSIVWAMVLSVVSSVE